MKGYIFRWNWPPFDLFMAESRSYLDVFFKSIVLKSRFHIGHYFWLTWWAYGITQSPACRQQWWHKSKPAKFIPSGLYSILSRSIRVIPTVRAVSQIFLVLEISIILFFPMLPYRGPYKAKWQSSMSIISIFDPFQWFYGGSIYI